MRLLRVSLLVAAVLTAAPSIEAVSEPLPSSMCARFLFYLTQYADALCVNETTCPGTYTAYPSYTCLVPTENTCCYGDGFCAPGPCAATGTCVHDELVESCDCDPGYTGSTCDTEICDLLTPCENGGTCQISVTAPEYECLCPDGFTDQNCTTDECGLDPCVNGTCNQIEGGYNCTCDPGFSGYDCDVDACDPAGNVCNTNGDCVRLDGDPLYECNCYPGFYGLNCEFSACSPDPCDNGMCNGMTTEPYYNCTCDGFYTGYNCTDLPCDSNPCLNGGNCTDLFEDFECECPLNLTGAVCDEIVCLGDDSQCTNSAQGTCVPLIDGTYRCDCEPDYFGDTCNDTQPPCGIITPLPTSRLSGATADSMNLFPWTAQITPTGIGLPVGHGVIVAPDVILTTAKVIKDCEGTTCTATAGVWDTTITTYKETVDFTVANTMVHPDNPASGSGITEIGNNAALISLPDAFNISGQIKTICPPLAKDLLCGLTCYASSMAYHSATQTFGDNSNLRRYLEVHAPNLPDSLCDIAWGGDMPANTTCSVGLDGGMCLGDEGTPIVCVDADGRHTFQGFITGHPFESPPTICNADTLLPIVDGSFAWDFYLGNV